MRGWWALLLCGSWLATTGARAQSVVVFVPPALEDGGSAEDAEAALQAVTERLRGEDYTVISPGQAASAMAALADETDALEASPHACVSLACAARFRAFFDAQFGLRLLVTGDDGSGGERVSVSVVESERDQWTGSASLDEGDLQQAALHALAVALRRRSERRGPWLSVEGTPQGAEVVVDDRVVGTLPFDGRFSPGEHEVQVRSDVRSSERRRVRLPVSSAAERRVQLSLGTGAPLLPPPEAPAEVAEAQPEPPRDDARASPLYDYVLGGVLIAGGAVLALAGPAATAARSGQCADGSADVSSCTEVYGANGGTWGQVVGGLALVGGGVAMLTVKPFQLMMGADRHGALMGVQGRF